MTSLPVIAVDNDDASGIVNDNTTPVVLVDANQVPPEIDHNVIDVDLIKDASSRVVFDVPPRLLLTKPEVIDVDLDDSLLTEVYHFGGPSEFEARSNDHRNVKKSIHQKFKNLQQKGYGEVDLLNLRPWYEDLRFDSMVIDYANANKQPTTQWHWRLIMIHPDATNVHCQESDVAVFTSLLRQFYLNAFTDLPSTIKLIDLAVGHDISFLVVVMKCGINKSPQPFSSEKLTSSNIVGAITFRSVVDPNVDENLSLFVEWLAVAKHPIGDKYAEPPKPFTQWRQQGFALFLMKCIIKYAFIHHNISRRNSPNASAPSVEVYLQSHDVPAFKFYSKIGFTQLNGTYDDGFELLPEYLQFSIMSPPATSRAIGDCLFTFAATEGDDDYQTHQLMYLRSGSLRWFREKQLPPSTSSGYRHSYWCAYPPRCIQEGLHSVGYANELLTQWLEDLPVLKQLIPPTYSDSPPLSRLLVRGEITFDSRVEHSMDKGKKWLSTGEIDLLLSTIAWDGRYDDYCYIVSCGDMILIQLAFEAYSKYTKAKQSYDTVMKEDGDLNAFHDYIMEEYKKPYHELADVYIRLRKGLMKKILKNAGLLSRRVIVFPINEDNAHWAVTFVFNASFIDDVQSSDPSISNKSLRPCFFRFCSLQRSGRRSTGTSQGVAWFLNLCYSLRKHEKEHGMKSKQNFEMHYPYGNALDGNMLGTAAFPALYFDQSVAEECLPLQLDGFNCGIGVPTCVAIVLRDVVIQDIRNDASLITYEEMFNVKNIETKDYKHVSDPSKNEHYCDFSSQQLVMQALPWKSTNTNDYLRKVREEWFRLIDKVAEHQYVIFPKLALGKKFRYVVPAAYENCKEQLTRLQWPPERHDEDDKKKPGRKPIPRKKDHNVLDVNERALKPLGNETKKSGKRGRPRKTTPTKKSARNVKPKVQQSNVKGVVHETPEEDRKPRAKSNAEILHNEVGKTSVPPITEIIKEREIPSLKTAEAIYQVIDCKQVFGLRRMTKSAIFKPTMPLEEFFWNYRSNVAPPFFEAPLETFVPWFSGLPFCNVLDESNIREFIDGRSFLEKGSSVMWDYRLFILDNGRIKGGSPGLGYAIQNGIERREWAKKKLLNYYQEMFDIPPDHPRVGFLANKIGSGWSIFITGTPLDTKNNAPDTLIGNEEFQIIAATTYYHGDYKDGEGHFALIKYIAVANAKRCPNHISQWRHLRLGAFLLQVVIKVSVLVGSQQGNELNTALFTQCSDDGTAEDRLFFNACGFQVFDDGEKERPKSLQEEMITQNACTMVLNHGQLIIPGPYKFPVARMPSQIELPSRTAAEGRQTLKDSATDILANFLTIREEIDAEFNPKEETGKCKARIEVSSSKDIKTTVVDTASIVLDDVKGKKADGEYVDFPHNDIMSVISKHGDETSIPLERSGNHMGSKESKWFLRNKDNITELCGTGELRNVQDNECTYNDEGVLSKIGELEIRKRGVNIATRPIPFEGRACLRVANAEDLVEANARTLLERIRAKDASAAKKLERGIHRQKSEREGCMQSMAFCDHIEETYGTRGPLPPLIDMKLFNREMEQFIEASFVAWKWHTNKQHNDVVKMWTKRYFDTSFHQDSEKKKRRIQFMIKALKDDRKKFREHFANEFKCSKQSLVKSVKFDEKRNSFIALLTWNEEVPVMPAENDPINKKRKNITFETVTRSDEIPIEKEWVKQQFGNEMFQYIVNMRQHPSRKWVASPRDVQVYIGRHRIVRVRYTPPQMKNIVDITRLKEMIDESDDDSSVVNAEHTPTVMSSPVMTLRTCKIVTSPDSTLSSRIVRGRNRVPKKIKESSPAAIVRNVVADDDDIKAETVKYADKQMEENKEIPRIPINVPGGWTGRSSNGSTVQLTEEFVRTSFGNAFANELKKMRRGFVDIPVGDFKSSRLHEHPELQLENSPRMHFLQSEGQDLCVSKSLASAFFALGWPEVSEKIDAFGENILKGKVVMGLERVVQESKKILPRWITVERIRNAQKFNWETDLLSNDVVIGVLRASDGNCSHAVTIYGGGFVFDANEAVALPLCQEALDYCTSTETVKTSFVCFHRAYRYRYTGKKQERIAKMTIHNRSPH